MSFEPRETAPAEEAAQLPDVIRHGPPVEVGDDTQSLSDDPVSELRKDLGIVLGVNIGQALLLFLISIARYALHACSAALIGASGVGKSLTARTILRLLPGTDTTSLTDVSYAALTSGLGAQAEVDHGQRVIDLRKHLLCLDENSRNCDPKVLSALRQLTSTPETMRSKIERGEAVTTKLLGPVSVIDCCLDTTHLDYQTSNRLVAIRLDEDADTLNAIMRRAASAPTREGRLREQQAQAIGRKWCRHLLHLDQDLGVVIEYGGQVVPSLPTNGALRITHGPRIVAAVQSVISAVAWLRQGLKTPSKNPAGEGRIIFATREDYRLAHGVLLAGNVVDERASMPGPSLRLLSRWQDVAAKNGNPALTALDLYSRAGITVDRGTMTRQLKALIDLELVVGLPTRNRDRHKLFQLTDGGLQIPTIGLLHTLPQPSSLVIEDEKKFQNFAEPHSCLRGSAQSPGASVERN